MAVNSLELVRPFKHHPILGDPGADHGGKGKSKRVKENGDEAKHSRARRAPLLALLCFSSSPFSFSRLDIPLPPRSTPGSHREVSNGKTVLPFQTFRCSRKFSSGTNQRVAFHLQTNRNFPEFFLNGKQPLFLPLPRPILERVVSAIW